MCRNHPTGCELDPACLLGIFSDDNPAHDDASTHQGRLQKSSVGHAYVGILNLRCDLDPEHSNPVFSQERKAYDDVPSNKVWLQTK